MNRSRRCGAAPALFGLPAMREGIKLGRTLVGGCGRRAVPLQLPAAGFQLLELGVKGMDAIAEAAMGIFQLFQNVKALFW